MEQDTRVSSFRMKVEEKEALEQQSRMFLLQQSSISLPYDGMKKGRGDPREDSGKGLKAFLLIH